MNIKEVKTALPVLLKHKIVPILWGSQGKGKTQVVKDIAKNLGYESVVHLCLATQEVGDLVGVLLEQPDGTAKHTRPDWFPKEGKHLVFLDEINRAHPDVQQGIFTFLLEGKIHQHVLPPDCAIIAAANYQSNKFNVTDMSDSALMSRFCHIDFKPTPEEFIIFAESKGHEDVADFIRADRTMLERDIKEGFNFNQVEPCRRSWADFIGPLEKEGEIEDVRYELYCGIVGQVASAAFQTWKAKKNERLSPKDIIKSYQKVKGQVMKLGESKDARLDLLNSTCEELLSTLEGNEYTDEEINNIKLFILDIPLEMSLKLSKKLTTLKWKQKTKILNDAQFVALFSKAKLETKKGANK